MRLDKLTTKFQEALSDAQSLALGNDNAYIEPVHVLAAMLRQQDGPAALLQRAGVNTAKLSQDAEAAVKRLPTVTGQEQVQPGPDLLLADPRVCRYYLVEVFHLFGFRDCGERPDGTRCFRRRRPDYRKLARVGLDGSASG